MRTVISEVVRGELIEGAMKSPVSVRDLGVGDAIVVKDRTWEHQRFVGRVNEANSRLGYVVVLLDGGGVRVFDDRSYSMFRMTNDAAKVVLSDG
jgi:hypothetical protein